MPFFPYFSSDIAVFIARVVLGLVLAVHGFPKLKNLKGTGEWFHSVGFKPGIFWATVVALLEFFGGILIILGIYTSFLALLVAMQFLVITAWKLWTRQKFVGGIELDLLILAIALMLIGTGGGGFALSYF